MLHTGGSLSTATVRQQNNGAHQQGVTTIYEAAFLYDDILFEIAQLSKRILNHDLL
jgi:hypothetical protein